MTFTIEDAKQVQRDLRLGDRHVAYMDTDEGFVLAHTDFGRTLVSQGFNLEWCEIHKWLTGNSSCCLQPGCFQRHFPEPGWYEIRGLHDVKGLAL